jgi:hypothetical protein
MDVNWTRMKPERARELVEVSAAELTAAEPPARESV